VDLGLAQRGFFAIQKGDLVSSDGETIVGMKDGVEYFLRFGNTATVAGADDPAGGDAAKEEGAEPVSSSGRYLFVSARLNEELLEKPQLEPLPDAPAEGDAKEADSKKDGGENKDGAADELKKAEEAEAKAQAALEERRRVEAENRRKQEQYDEQVKAAQKRVRDLNNRFADWYYVVSDKEYDKIHLGRDEMIQKKDADEKKD
jgi:hypothetical protein